MPPKIVDDEKYVFEIESAQNTNDNQMEFPLNTILYGPPGTGKTYHTINKALEICGEDVAALSRSEMKQLFDEKVNEGDFVVEKQGVAMVVDPMSLQYLMGGVVDYTEGLQGSRFIVQNPNATTTCGCGSSFSV